jgi:hypothetical protein
MREARKSVCRESNTLTLLADTRTLAALDCCMPHILNRRMLARATALLGGEEALAQRLGVSIVRVQLWSAGAERPPLSVFLKLVDLLLAPESGTPAPRQLKQPHAVKDAAEAADPRSEKIL